ncbi:hypothetical protein D3C86_2201790 [compost metagenome]
MLVEVVPVRDYRGGVIVRDFVVPQVEARVGVRVLEEKVNAIGSAAVVGSYKIFKFWHDLIPFRMFKW